MVDRVTNAILPVVVDSTKARRANPVIEKAPVRKIFLNAQRELELVKQIRSEAERYRKETQEKARSQASLLMLQTRFSTQKEAAELMRKFSEELWEEMPEFKRKISEELRQEITEFKREITEQLHEEIARYKHTVSEETKQILDELRTLRTAAREELKAQEKIGDASRINALSLTSMLETEQIRSNGNGSKRSTVSVA